MTERVPGAPITRDQFDDLLFLVGSDALTRRALSVSWGVVVDVTGTFAGAALAY